MQPYSNILIVFGTTAPPNAKKKKKKKKQKKKKTIRISTQRNRPYIKRGD